MTYCVMCSTSMLERTVSDRVVLLCTSCGAVLEQIAPSRYRYVGTTHGNHQLRELLAIIDNVKEEQNETVAFKIDTSP